MRYWTLLALASALVIGLGVSLWLLAYHGLEGKAVAEMRLDRRVYRVGDTARLTVVNLGEAPLILGRPYRIYWWNGSAWEFSDRLTPDVWTMEVYILKKGDSFTQELSLEGARPGRYKVVKEALEEGADLRLTLEVEFQVEN